MTWQMCLLLIFLTLGCSHGLIFAGSTLEQIKDDIDKLEKIFNASQSDVAKGGSVFIHRLKSDLWAEPSEKKILLAQMITLYLEMLKNVTNVGATEPIRHLVPALEHYKKNYNESLEKAEDIIELAKLQMANFTIQRKAVLELHSVLLEMNHNENQMRRRKRWQNGQQQRRPNLKG